MNTRQLGFAAAVAVTMLSLGIVLPPAARSQGVQAAPSFVPIGVSSSGATSTVWFHEPSSRQTLACQTVPQGAGIGSIQCVAAKLPS